MGRVLLSTLLFFLALQPPGASAKEIRLRNGTIVTPEPGRAAARLQAAEPAGPGLHLIQFSEPPVADVRAELTRLGVELLGYVPDDAFIARLAGVDLGVLRAVPTVRWVGEYRPDLKVAVRLRELAARGEFPEVSLAVSPSATPVERVALRRTMALHRRESRARPGFGGVLTGRVSPAQLAALARSPLVLWIEPAARHRLFDEISSKIVAGGTYVTGEAGEGFPGIGGGDDDEDDGLGGGLSGARTPGLQAEPARPHETVMAQLGFDGRGVGIAVADSGLMDGVTDTMHPDLGGRVDAFFFYGSLTDAADEHSHGTHVTGIVAGDGATGEMDEFGNLFGLGVAPRARIVAQRIFDGIGNYEAPPTYETLTRDAVRAGAVIGSNSWGDDTQGRYDLSAAEFDALVRDADDLAAGEQPYILEFSAGNSGPGGQTIGSPAVGKNVIASGASQNDRYGFFMFEDGTEAMADFSSRGPCEDGRIKPDVVAPGTWIASLQSSSATDESAWLPISANYQFQGGTSQSGPHVSGAAAILVQYWRETHGGATPSPALVKALLINSAVDLDDASGGTGPIPNQDEGWGRVTLTNVIGSIRKYEVIDQTVALTNRALHEVRVLVGNPREPLKVTLTYTDVPGLPAAVPALVNDLDLEVTGPDGTLYRGNAFAGGESIPNALAADFVNNVEGVHLATPQPGEYLVRVRASRVVLDIHGRPGVAPVQDFALALSADLPLPGQGILVLDRTAYSAPATVALKLIDADLRSATEAVVTVVSGAEPGGERIVLVPVGAGGVFTGAVATVTVTGPALADGRLQVAHGDTLVVRYQDDSPAGERTMDAAIDLVAPVLSAVTAGTRFGRLLVSWASDEEADSIVEYGTTGTLGSAVTNRAFVMTHAIPLDGLEAGQTVFYRVRSRDAAGNQTISDNAGRPHEAKVAATSPVLLVDQFDDLILNDSVSIAGYTDALDAIGAPYEVWSVATEGRAPKFEELRNYPIVIWRVGEFFNSLTAADIAAMRDYVESGGGLFMASMELLTRLDEAGFSSFRKNVLHVEGYDVDPGISGVYGSASLSMTSGIETVLDFSEYPDLFIIPQDLSDTFRPTTNAAPVLFDADTGKAVGVRWPRTGEEGRGRVVFFSFPFDTIPLDGEAPNNRVEILRRVLAFLSPALGGTPNLELDREQYTIPALATVEVSDARRAGASSVTVRVRTEREGVDGILELLPTGVPGEFRGYFKVTSENQPPAVGEIRARDGDLLLLQYTGVTAADVVGVEAAVDVLPPEITGVEIVPEYNSAIVRWQTSEPADGLVKYLGVGFPSNFTGYHPDYVTAHELLIEGLEPDREYELVIVSRDPAGNAATEDNGGKFHRFRTLRPLTPPFIDDLERGGTNWFVGGGSLDAETLSLLVATTWELGRPGNELASAARSGLACWGTNLRGEVNDYSECSLISPAIRLTGGNRATLSFWQNYDFFPRSDEGDILEVGALYVTTNNGAVWTPIRDYPEASDGWEEETVDLSVYLGQTIRLGWAYGLFSFGSVEHPGWLVDDVAVSVSSFVPSTLILSNNLHQAAVSIRGPVSRVERGRLLVLTNMPPGEYRFEYGDIPFHVTPEVRTNQVEQGSTLVIDGTYTFPDANGNGISDTWEEHYLGGARPGHPGTADTDGDGFSDFGEFAAGTHPTNALSRLTLIPPLPLAPTGPGIVLRWESIQGHGYRVLGSADALGWTPLTDWLRATSSALSVTVPLPTPGSPHLFRLETQP